MSEQLPPAARLTVRSAMFLGVGSMIGAGIFALLGEVGSIAGAAVWMAFLVGGVVAALLGYVCAKLGSRYRPPAGSSRRSRRASAAAPSSASPPGSATSRRSSSSPR
jgi:amino acid transporter